jgi:hypothetical protein
MAEPCKLAEMYRNLERNPMFRDCTMTVSTENHAIVRIVFRLRRGGSRLQMMHFALM